MQVVVGGVAAPGYEDITTAGQAYAKATTDVMGLWLLLPPAEFVRKAIAMSNFLLHHSDNLAGPSLLRAKAQHMFATALLEMKEELEKRLEQKSSWRIYAPLAWHEVQIEEGDSDAEWLRKSNPLVMGVEFSIPFGFGKQDEWRKYLRDFTPPNKKRRRAKPKMPAIDSLIKNANEMWMAAKNGPARAREGVVRAVRTANRGLANIERKVRAWLKGRVPQDSLERVYLALVHRARVRAFKVIVPALEAEARKRGLGIY